MGSAQSHSETGLPKSQGKRQQRPRRISRNFEVCEEGAKRFESEAKGRAGWISIYDKYPQSLVWVSCTAPSLVRWVGLPVAPEALYRAFVSMYSKRRIVSLRSVCVDSCTLFVVSHSRVVAKSTQEAVEINTPSSRRYLRVEASVQVPSSMCDSKRRQQTVSITHTSMLALT